MNVLKFIYLLALTTAIFACNGRQKEEIPLLDKSAFETNIDGKPVSLYTLRSEGGLVMQVTNFGLRVISLWVPDKNGKYEDVSVGYENIEKYIHNPGERFLGSIVGRYANRIANGTFQLDGNQYQLPLNNNGQTLHGGLHGLDMVVWKVDDVTPNSIKFSYTSPDGDEGFPGNLHIEVQYTLSAANEFKLSYKATTDKPTVVNLSNHAFFNLKGEGKGTITDHILTINAGNITPVNEVLIPTGELTSVENTPFDFRRPTTIGQRIGVDDQQLKNGLGYDHNWVLDRKSDNNLELAVTLYEPLSGRVMEVYTDQPGVQFYIGNFFDGSATGKHGKPIAYRESLALETQKFPDSPNQPHFPSTRLNPGEVYTHNTIYKFSVRQ